MQAEYAETLSYISQHGPDALYNGLLGNVLVDYMKAKGGFIAHQDLKLQNCRAPADPRRLSRLDHLGPPPPAASGVHITQMLNILEGYDIAALGFGTARDHPLSRRSAEDRLCRSRSRKRRSRLYQCAGGAADLEGLCRRTPLRDRQHRAQAWGAGVKQLESAHTTHMTAADAFGNVVATTQTINNLFGAKILIPGLGTIPNNYMNLYDPRPGHALSLAPGKRVTTSMSPMMALHGGKLRYALGLPGGKRIFPSALQALLNLIDHGMSLQEAVEAPRVWTEGNALEVELACRKTCVRNSPRWDTDIAAMPTVAGGMNGIAFMRTAHVGRRLLARRRHADRHGRRPRARRGAVHAAVRETTSARRSRARRMPWHRSSCRTQLTLLAVRKSRTASGGTSAAAARIGRACDHHRLQLREPRRTCRRRPSPPRRRSRARAPATEIAPPLVPMP